MNQNNKINTKYKERIKIQDKLHTEAERNILNLKKNKMLINHIPKLSCLFMWLDAHQPAFWNSCCGKSKINRSD